MEISYQISWRQSSSSCDSTSIANGNLVSGGSTLHCQYGCSDAISQMSYVCTCFNTDSGEDWSFGEHRITYIFNNTNDQNTVTIGTNGGAWISAVGDGSWNVSTTFSLVRRADTGIVNSSPRISSSLPLRLQEGCSYTIPLAVTDPDNDIIRCRWAVGTECSGICDRFPGANLDSTSCTITYTANEGTGINAAAIMIEDYAPASLNHPLSSVALQFVVSVISSNQPCSMQTEYFISPSITLHPSNKVVLWNESVTLTCMANEALYYYWEKQNSDIPFNSIGMYNNTLTLVNVQPQDTGSYRCVAFNCGVNSRRYSDYATVTVGKLLL